MDYKINVGDPIPSFHLVDEEGYELTEEDLLGTPTIIYFYPKDGTTGCTKEACDFRDHINQIDAMDAMIVGISPDSASSHDQFAQKHDLPFTLLSDEKMDLCRKFDVLREKVVDGKKTYSVERTTFIADTDGIIRWIERPVNVEGHVGRVLAALEKFSSGMPS